VSTPHRAFLAFRFPIEWEEDPLSGYATATYQPQHFRKGPEVPLKGAYSARATQRWRCVGPHLRMLGDTGTLGYPGFPFRWAPVPLAIQTGIPASRQFVQPRRSSHSHAHTPVSLMYDWLTSLSNALIAAGHNPTIVGNLINSLSATAAITS